MLGSDPDTIFVYDQDFEYIIGKSIELRSGTDVAIIATGMMVKESLQAADILEQKGISCTV